jgi:two-component system, chemotaxis family, protein-glutamate methylesterase/glutaminase
LKPSVVVIGTSLGGLSALSALLRALPSDFAVPIAIAQHRGKTEDNALERLLDAQTSLEVCEANDKQALEPGHVYLAPADYHLLLEPTSLALSTGAPETYARPSIDVLFESAADAHGSGVLAVILTGANHDGARGCRRVKARGGRLLVEDPATAFSSAMPSAAIAATHPDAVLPLLLLCERLIQICQLPPASSRPVTGRAPV